MKRGEVIQILRDHEQELKSAGILHLRVFGSVARDEPSAQSDVDLLADFDGTKRLTLLTVARLQSLLTELLGAKVDLSSSSWMRDPARTKAISEAVLAF